MRIQIITLLISFQCLVACQQIQEKAFPLAADLAMHSSTEPTQKCSEKAPTPTANIIFKSTDNGQTWQDVSAGLPDEESIDCFLAQNGEILLGNASGLYRSKATASNPVWEKEYMLDGEIFDVSAGQAGPYAFSSRNGFFQNISEGIWMPVCASLKEQHFRTIFESLNGTLFVGSDNGIFKSTDHGKTWKHVFEDGWVIKMVESNGVLICTNQQGILRSTDGGEHWDLVVTEGGVGIDVDITDGGFTAITYNTSSKTRRVRISTDSGKTWNPIDAGLPPDASISTVRQVGKYMFCGHPEGIYRSADQGKTWELILPSIGKKVFNLSVSGNVIYAIPRSGGC